MDFNLQDAGDLTSFQLYQQKWITKGHGFESSIYPIRTQTRWARCAAYAQSKKYTAASRALVRATDTKHRVRGSDNDQTRPWLYTCVGIIEILLGLQHLVGWNPYSVWDFPDPPADIPDLQPSSSKRKAEAGSVGEFIHNHRSKKWQVWCSEWIQLFASILSSLLKSRFFVRNQELATTVQDSPIRLLTSARVVTGNVWGNCRRKSWKKDIGSDWTAMLKSTILGTTRELLKFWRVKLVVFNPSMTHTHRWLG